MEDLQTQLSKCADVLVVLGQLPEPTLQHYSSRNSTKEHPSQNGYGRRSCGCVGGSNIEAAANHHADLSKDMSNVNGDNLDDDTTTTEAQSSSLSAATACMIHGGLELPSQMDWSRFTLLYIGNVLDDDENDDEHLQYRP